MPKIKCTRKIHFCSGHRVLNHESKCANAHGHNYVLWVYAEGDTLDSIGRVIDFSVLKERIGSWIDEYWDHTFLINIEDHEMMNIKDVLVKNKTVFPCSFNPTAENMATYLLHNIIPSLMEGTGVVVTKVVLYETENCFAEVEL